jgi:hypothetical protein
MESGSSFCWCSLGHHTDSWSVASVSYDNSESLHNVVIVELGKVAE